MSFIEELKRRNVVRVGVVYLITAWLLAQVADLLLENFNAPGWVIHHSAHRRYGMSGGTSATSVMRSSASSQRRIHAST